ncbi:hypothetical protein [Peptoniphilus timonensis]|uniref:hypothetical protein n=1 Tax=Peptoniphilus timonensis TaxID=1268254 RepID=UPI0002F92660|nr:hypothetical protein [Peptoniphilus timonensis]
MERKFKLIFGLTVLLGITQPTFAKEMRLVDSGSLYNKETKKIVFPQDKKIFEVNDANKDSSWDGYNVEYKGKKYFINSYDLIEPELYDRYIHENKVKVEFSTNNDIYNYVNFYNSNQYIENIVDNFCPEGNTDLEQLKEVMIELKKLNLRYAWSDDISQWDSIQYGYSACHGIAYLQKLLLDKTNVEYRVVLERPVNYIKEIEDPVSPAHIFLEVKIDDNWYAVDATQLLRKENSKEEMTYYDVQKAIDFMMSNILKSKVDYTKRSQGFFDIAINPEYPDVISRVSGTYKRNKKIKDDGFNAWFSSKTLNQFKKEM